MASPCLTPLPVACVRLDSCPGTHCCQYISWYLNYFAIRSLSFLVLLMQSTLWLLPSWRSVQPCFFTLPGAISLFSLQALPWLLLGSKFAALSVSLWPYYLLASMFIVIWVHLATATTTSVCALLKAFGCWVIMISAWCGVFIILPYCVSENLDE